MFNTSPREFKYLIGGYSCDLPPHPSKTTFGRAAPYVRTTTPFIKNAYMGFYALKILNCQDLNIIIL